MHSDLGHLVACLELARRRHVQDVVVHAFLDGRDTPPQSAKGYLAEIGEHMDRLGLGRYGVISGRYYAMDRDTRWDRVKLAYDALVHGEGFFAANAQAAVDAAYRRGETDEFVRPTIVAPEREPRVKDGDVCIFFNFRPDRARELTRAFFEKDFGEFDRGAHPPAVDFVTMTQYKKEFPLPGGLPARASHARARRRARRARPAAAAHRRDREVRARHVLLQRRRREGGAGRGAHPRAQPARRAHLRPQAGDERLRRHRRARRRSWSAGAYDFVVVNYANADMVGHTGVIDAAVAAVEAVDACLGRVVDLVTRLGGVCLITADHGNSDHMLEPDGSPNTAHSTNLVPFIATVDGVRVRDGGRLCDLAPTALALLGLETPAEMTGASLLQPAR